MAKKAPVKVVEENVSPIRGRKDWTVNNSPEMKKLMDEYKKTQEEKRKKASDYRIAECPSLNLRQLYNFEFNENVKNKLLRGSIRTVTGELAMHFIKSNYGVLCL
jgi:hypothetical protein